MQASFQSAATFEHSPHCVVRAQEDGFLVYNQKTDELHLLSRLGHYVYELCDGTRDVGTIGESLGAAPDDGNSVRRFIEQLVTRGILRRTSDD